MSANINFISSALIKERTGISNAIDDKDLKPVIKLAQDIFVQPALGSKLYLRLQTAISDASISANETILLNTYVTDCLMWAAIAYLPANLSYGIYAKGVLQKTSEQSQSPSKNELDSVTTHYQNIAEFYKQRLINYLRTNYLLFADYTDTACSWETIKPDTNAYECPIYLGDDVCGPCYPSSGGTAPSSSDGTITYTAAGGEISFALSILDGKTILTAVRSGLVKAITSEPTVDTAYLQRVGTAIILPTGDVANAGELFIFLYR